MKYFIWENIFCFDIFLMNQEHIFEILKATDFRGVNLSENKVFQVERFMDF